MVYCVLRGKQSSASSSLLGQLIFSQSLRFLSENSLLFYCPVLTKDSICKISSFFKSPLWDLLPWNVVDSLQALPVLQAAVITSSSFHPALEPCCVFIPQMRGFLCTLGARSLQCLCPTVLHEEHLA
jgi:hypothetical protein